MIQVCIGFETFQIKAGMFPNGESFVDVSEELAMALGISRHVNVKFKFENDSEIFTLQMLKNFLDENNISAELVMPYVPYSRMDRQENMRMFSLKTFTQIINQMGFNRVKIAEPHSDVCVALLDRVVVEPMTVTLANQIIGKEDYVVFPDAGAQKRYMGKIKGGGTITCDKHRNFDTGNIDYFTCKLPDGVPKNFSAVIVDDLCSKGGTFVMAADTLRKKGAKKVSLVVTHCENTVLNGLIPTSALIDRVYTTDSIYTGDCDKIEIAHHFFKEEEFL